MSQGCTRGDKRKYLISNERGVSPWVVDVRGKAILTDREKLVECRSKRNFQVRSPNEAVERHCKKMTNRLMYEKVAP